jgi:prepilin-type N-terminal cleavage/methylation domain-containing protein
MDRRRGFTLIELLVVIGIVAILAVVVVLVINPVALLQEARDANRVSDMETLNKAVLLYSQDAMANPSAFLAGTPSVIYVSVPDPQATSTAGDQCQGLGLPAAPTGFTYQCASVSTYTKTDGTGWVPINFNAYSAGSILPRLPVDPTNNTSSLLYYTYVTNGDTYELTAPWESQKYLKQYLLVSSPDPVRQVVGTNSSLVSQEEGLIGSWNFEEGAGTITADGSGNGNSMTVSTAGSSSAPIWTGSNCRVGAQCLVFSGINRNGAYTATDAKFNFTGDLFTFMEWVSRATSTGNIAANGGNNSGGNCSTYSGGWLFGTSNFIWCTTAQIGTAVQGTYLNYPLLPVGTWTHIAVTFDPLGKATLYDNGVAVASSTSGGIGYNGAAQHIVIGCEDNVYNCFSGTVDDARLYGRALSAAEVRAIYNAEK